MSNFFGIEQALIERIREQVPGLADVGSVSKLAGYADVPSPAVYVMPDDAEVEGGPNDGAVQVIRQRWQVVVTVAHMQDVLTEDYDTTAKRAGEILYQVCQALIGWRPASGWERFALRAMLPPQYDPGYGDFPALFETGFVITGT